MFSRLVHGTRYSLLMGSMVVSISLAAGIWLGLIAGFARGVVEILIMRLMDIMLTIPGILDALAAPNGESFGKVVDDQGLQVFDAQEQAQLHQVLGMKLGPDETWDVPLRPWWKA